MTAVLLAIAALVALPVAASAAPNTGIAVGGVSIIPADAQLKLGDTAVVEGTWDASTANPQPGDTFTIALPAELAFPQAIPLALVGEDGTTWGNCLTDPATGIMTCTLTDAVVDRPEDVRGTWRFEVEAVRATAADEVAFTLNGTDVLVDLPGTGGIDDGIELPDEVSKSGVMNQNNWSMTWTVDIPGANMAGQGTVTLHDTLGAGHALCDPTSLTVQTVRGSAVTDVTDLVTTAPIPGDTEFDIVLTAPAGGFRADATYRVTYQTCTPDGQIDPEGTTYENSAQIEGWGSAGVGVGTVTNRPWLIDLTKSGTVRGGADRNGVIAWTVSVPGEQLFGKDGFTLAETLGAGHQVCADTVSGIRIVERYGPSTQRQVDISSLLEATTVSSAAQAFEVRFDIDDPDFTFKASDYRYIITYETCVTSDELPEGGTAYANSVSIDGVVAGSEATVPSRSQGKTGSLNTSVRTIDGVEYMPQTTLDWRIRIPGERIEDTLDVLTLTDTISAAHAVCMAGDPSDGLAARLNLKVEAIDQITNGGLSSVDLTEVTTVSLDEQEITFEIEATALPTPTGTSDGFSREYQYVLTYTTCTTSGGMDAPGTHYSNAVTGSGIDFTTTTTQNNSASGTGQGVTRGSVSIDKVLADTPGAAFVPADAVFTVHVAEVDPTGATQTEYDLQVPLDGQPVSGFNARGTGWTIVLTEPTLPHIPGVAFGEPSFAESTGVTVSDGGTVATASITPGANVSVVLTNEPLLGAMRITKALTGGAADEVDPDRQYDVMAVIDVTGLGDDVPPQPDRQVRLKLGEPITLDGLPIGSIVTVTEARPVDDDTFTWADPVVEPALVEITAENADTPALVTITNAVERTVGTFAVSKVVTGEQAENPAVPDTVTVEATWEQPAGAGSTTLTLPTDGTSVPLGVDLLVGTKVTLTETPLTDGDSITWAAPVWTGHGVTVDGASAVVTIGRGAEAVVQLENHAATSTAGISVIKGIAGEAAAEVDPSTQFPVTATWTDAEGASHSRDLLISAAEPTPLGVDLPAGTVVTLTEGEAPAFDTVVWGGIAISGEGVTDDGDGVASVVVSDQQGDVTLVSVVNDAGWAPGTFSIAKTTTGVLLDDPDVPETVTVVATWLEGADEHSATIEVPTDGTVTEFPQQLPHGTAVTLTEGLPNDSARFTWATPVWSGDAVAGDPGAAIVTIGAATVQEVAIENTAVPSLGSMSLTKNVNGDGASAAAGVVFPVSLTWIDLLGVSQTREVVVRADETIVVDDLPLGVEIAAVEHEVELPSGVVWDAATWSAASDGVVVSTEEGSTSAVFTLTGHRGATAAITLDNEMGELGELAITGGSSIPGIVVVAALLMIIAGLLLRHHGRRVKG